VIPQNINPTQWLFKKRNNQSTLIYTPTSIVRLKYKHLEFWARDLILCFEKGKKENLEGG
jgi:hypothetical protein